MEQHFHRFSDLFAQLGLPADADGIADFLRRHSPLAPEVCLADAPFWSTAQATLLREEILDDADWAEVIDQLDTALRGVDRLPGA